MSYLAIARKYRPSTFDEIVGQEHVTRTLKNAIERERIHHGFLFTGARGVGKTTAARALARALNCEKGPTPTPCGTCTSCVEIGGGRSPDLIEIDGASNNSVDDVRELRETVKYAPTQGRWKIYLIDEVHMLSKGAFNALLKTLEEPPPHVVFIFATTEANRIPDTILSRVQRFDFKRIPANAVVKRLQMIMASEGVTISETALRMIARAGEGSMRDAESLLDQVISYAGNDINDDQVAETLGLIDRSLLYDMLEGLIQGEPDKCLTAIESVYGYGYELSVFTTEMLEVLRNATFCRLSKGARKHIDVSVDELERLDALTNDIHAESLTRTFNAMLDVHDQVSRSSRPRIVLEMAVARLATTRPVQPVADLLGRLDAMERRLRQGGASASPRRDGRESRPRRGGPGTGSDDDRRGRQPRGAKAPTVSPPPAPQPPPQAQGGQRPQSVPPTKKAAHGRTGVAAQDSFYDSLARSADTESPGAPSSSPGRSGRGRGPVLDTPDDRWRHFCSELRTTTAAMFAKGIPEWKRGAPLRIVFTSPRLVAEARRMQRGTVLDAARDSAYPKGTAIEVIDRAVTGSVRQDLLRQALTEPAVKRILKALDATAIRALPIGDKK